MLVDGLTLLGDSEITNMQIEQVTAFPTTNLGQGRLIYLSLAVGGEQPGLYISEANSIWVPVGNITDLVAGAGMIVNTVNGVSTLSVNTAVLGAVIYQGTWNALTNTPTLVSSVGIKGQYYTVSVGGTRNLDGSTVFQVGDMVIYSGTSWDKVDGAANEVRSVAGRTGDVVLSTADLAEASNLFYTDARARAAISVTGGSLTYNQATGVLSYTAAPLTLSAITTALGFTPVNGTTSTGTGANVLAVSPALTGVPTAPTVSVTDNSASLATTAFVKSQGYATAALTVATSTLAQPSGVATLDSSGKLLTAQIPAALVGAMQYQGAWDPSTNAPALTPSIGTKGQYYKVSTAATGYAKIITVTNNSGTNITSVQLLTTPSSIAVGDTITVNGGTATITAINSPAQGFQTFTPALSFSAGQTLRLGSSFDGLTQFTAGDIVAFNGSTWDGIDGSSSEVLSVAGKTGSVVLTAADVSALALTGGTLSGALTIAGSYVTPTYSTWSSGNLTNGATVNGLIATTGTNASNKIYSTIGVSTGKYFWEVTITSGGSQNPGVGIIAALNNISLAYQYVGVVGDVIGLALDFSTNTLKYYKNSVIVQTDTIVPGTYYAGVGTQSAANAVFTANFGASAFTNAVPTGFTLGLYTGGGTGGYVGLVQTAAQPAITSVGTLAGLVLSSDPTVALGAATKQYVDTRVSAGAVSSVFGRTGAVVLTSSDVTMALTYVPVAPGVNSTITSLTGLTTALSVLQGGTGVTTSTGTGANVLAVSPALTGVPTAPTAVIGTNTSQLATTAFVATSISGTKTYSTWNSADAGGSTSLSADLLTATLNNQVSSVRSTIGVSTGISYWEITYAASASTRAEIGISLAGSALGDLSVSSNAVMYYSNGDVYARSSTPISAYGAAFVVGDKVGVLLNMNAGTVTFYKNGVSQGVAYTGLVGTWHAAVGTGSSGAVNLTANFGASAFTYPVPTGASAGLFTAVAGLGVSSFNTRAGAVTLTAADVTSALTYTPASAGTNSNITSLTGLTTALSVLQGGTGTTTSTGSGSIVKSVSPVLTGTPTAPTAATADSSTAIATTAFVKLQAYGDFNSAGIVPMSGQLVAIAGTANAPGIVLKQSNNQKDTGFFANGDFNVTISVNGSAALESTTTQVTSFKALSSQVKMLTADGTVAAPTLTFLNDPTTGLYQIANGNIGFSTAGVLRANISSAGLTMTVPVVLSSDPVASMQAATKQYVDTKATSGSNSNITSLTGLTTALSVSQGGTGVKFSTGAGSNVLSISPTFTGNTALQSVLEKVSITAAAPAAITNLDISTAAIWNFTVAATANFTMNVRGNSTTTLDSIMSIGQSLSVAVLVLNGATAFYPTAYTVDGVAVTPKWNGTAPAAGSASAIDSYSLTFIKTAAATFTVLATVAKFA